MNATLSAIASESGLAVLGLSPGNLVSLGNMIQWARNYNAIMMGRWNSILPPIGGTILLFVGLGKHDIVVGDRLIFAGIALLVLWMVIWCACAKVREYYEKNYSQW